MDIARSTKGGHFDLKHCVSTQCRHVGRVEASHLKLAVCLGNYLLIFVLKFQEKQKIQIFLEFFLVIDPEVLKLYSEYDKQDKYYNRQYVSI